MNEKDLYINASGFFFARALQGQQSRWIVMRNLDREHNEVLMDESSVHEALEFQLLPINRMHVWLSSESKVERFRSASTVIKSALFWAAQRLLFTIEDLRKISGKGWKDVSAEYERGLLIWQQGWNAFPLEISRILTEEFVFE